jgi:hypothetical protein
LIPLYSCQLCGDTIRTNDHGILNGETVCGRCVERYDLAPLCDDVRVSRATVGALLDAYNRPYVAVD